MHHCNILLKATFNLVISVNIGLCKTMCLNSRRCACKITFTHRLFIHACCHTRTRHTGLRRHISDPPVDEPTAVVRPANTVKHGYSSRLSLWPVRGCQSRQFQRSFGGRVTIDTVREDVFVSINVLLHAER